MELPSLTALRAFESAARLGGFSAAGRELNVTHAAVAQQVRGLEAHLGLPLVYREGRGLALTDEGSRLASALRDGFATIADAIADLTEEDRARPLRVTITPNFARQWLMPRLGRFWTTHSEIALSLFPDQRLYDLKADRMDLAIRFGHGDWPGVEAEKLMPTHYTVIGATSLVGESGLMSVEDMTRLPWIFEEDWLEQEAWLASIGIDPGRLTIHRVPTEDLALEAARQGYGLHVELSTWSEADASSRAIRTVYEAPKDEAMGYWLVTRPGPKKPALKTFTRWLKSAL